MTLSSCPAFSSCLGIPFQVEGSLLSSAWPTLVLSVTGRRWHPQSASERGVPCPDQASLQPLGADPTWCQAFRGWQCDYSPELPPSLSPSSPHSDALLASPHMLGSPLTIAAQNSSKGACFQSSLVSIPAPYSKPRGDFSQEDLSVKLSPLSLTLYPLCVGQRVIFRSQFSPFHHVGSRSTIYIPRIELR